MRENIQTITLGFLLFFSLPPHSSAFTDEKSVNFFTQTLNDNLRNQYNSHLLRLRRTAVTSSPVTTATTGTRFRVGACKLEEFLHSSKNCTHAFYKSVRTKESSSVECSSDAYITLRKCMLDTFTECLNNARILGAEYLSDDTEAEITKNFMTFFGDEDFWCKKGGLGISSDYLPAGVMCDPIFYHISEGCTTTYRKFFNSSASDKKLCNEYGRAKKCFLETIFNHCSFSRSFRHSIEIMIEITADFQPFCKRTDEQERLTMAKLFVGKSCPPYSLADVAFVLDVTSGTTKKQYLEMKRMIEAVSQKMDYGMRGIQIAVFHFDTQLRRIFRFGGIPTKRGMQGSIDKMARTVTRAKDKAKRMTGRALYQLRRHFRSKGENKLEKEIYKTGQRPHNAAVVFVLTTGPSNDSMVSGLEQLKDRNVHVVFVGPHTLNVPTTSDRIIGFGVPSESIIEGEPVAGIGFPSEAIIEGETAEGIGAPSEVITSGDNVAEIGSYRVIATEFKSEEVEPVAKEMMSEICLADRKKQLFDSQVVVEGQESSSKWNHLQTLLSRFMEYDLSLVFDLKPIVRTNTQTPRPGGVSTHNPFLPSEEGMDGDLLFSQPDETTEFMEGWQFYGGYEYLQEGPY